MMRLFSIWNRLFHQIICITWTSLQTNMVKKISWYGYFTRDLDIELKIRAKCWKWFTDIVSGSERKVENDTTFLSIPVWEVSLVIWLGLYLDWIWCEMILCLSQIACEVILSNALSYGNELLQKYICQFFVINSALLVVLFLFWIFLMCLLCLFQICKALLKSSVLQVSIFLSQRKTI